MQISLRTYVVHVLIHVCHWNRVSQLRLC